MACILLQNADYDRQACGGGLLGGRLWLHIVLYKIIIKFDKNVKKKKIPRECRQHALRPSFAASTSSQHPIAE
ncbi:hypothetical protein BpHYR1_027007 [Brachionus plicatilis]|uniref:Uncharacterized protein n=1 Tax=Brachionus plicatilis TaxID=10195 RepID=A0A3M7SPD2_BRAPC|nr:hypothetical protein BpHYR1_027007 [Brachionus plicatilis]